MILFVFLWFIIGAAMAVYYWFNNVHLEPDGIDFFFLFVMLIIGPVVLVGFIVFAIIDRSVS